MGATLTLQHGLVASAEREERSAQESILQASKSMVDAFKMFTQCLGHDLRTPLQAAITRRLLD